MRAIDLDGHRSRMAGHDYISSCPVSSSKFGTEMRMRRSRKAYFLFLHRVHDSWGLSLRRFGLGLEDWCFFEVSTILEGSEEADMFE